MSHPANNLVRAYVAPDALELRASAEGDGNTMVGHFAIFNEWTRIQSMWEGDFMERIAPGAFKDTIARDNIKVLYDHGHDPQVGNKPLGVPTSLKEDARGAAYEVPLFDAAYVNDLKPAIRSGALGASFRFSVTGENWVTPSKPTDTNPAMLDERTITGTKVFEFGPVTFPAYEGASAGMRSLTDQFGSWMQEDPMFIARMTDRLGLSVVEKMLAGMPEDLRTATDEQAVDDPAHSQARRQWLAANFYQRKSA